VHFGSLSQDARAGNQAKCGHIFSHFECLQVISTVLIIMIVHKELVSTCTVNDERKLVHLFLKCNDLCYLFCSLLIYTLVIIHLQQK